MVSLKRPNPGKQNHAGYKSRNIESLPFMLNVDEVAEILRISRAGAYNFINKEKELPKVKIGRRLLISKEDLIRFLQQKKITA